MNFLTMAKLPSRQLRAVQLTEHIINSLEFEAWFVRYRFGDMANPPAQLNIEVLHDRFHRQQYRFEWRLVKRSWWKRRFGKKVEGDIIANIIVTYADVYERLTMPELCRHFARMMMHVAGFDEVDMEAVPNRSIPYQVGEYVYASACRLCKMNE